VAPGLAQRARELNIANRVRLLTRPVVGANKEYLYRSATLFVLPSYSENFGNTVLEAMQRGLLMAHYRWARVATMEGLYQRLSR
jgi:glycosyltransferase involved in cell wall biosynthesis